MRDNHSLELISKVVVDSVLITHPLFAVDIGSSLEHDY